jgi:hypothetical protein
VTSYTRLQRFPYPSSANERGNGALDLQLLAERADYQLDGLDTAWAAQLAKPTLIMTLTNPVTGLVANDFSGVLMDTQVVSKGGLTGTQVVQPSVALAGWYYYTVCLSTVPSGTVGSLRRLMEVRHLGTGPSGNFATLEAWRTEEVDSTGDTNLNFSMVVYLDGTTWLQPYVFHNASSTLTVNTNCTFVTATRLASGN